jgi:cation:H+ antiporter
MVGIALVSILGHTMVAIALAFGIAAVVAPMMFAQVPPQILDVRAYGRLNSLAASRKR